MPRRSAGGGAATGEGLLTTYGLDANDLQRVAGVTTTGASSNNLALTPYAYDGAGDVKAIGSQTFVYDKVGRLVTANIRANGTPKTQSTVFDAFGNITSTTTTDWGTQSFSLNAATNRLNSPVTYDSAGDITSWGGFSYTWDALGKLQAVTGTGINHTYLYTADGERISDRDANAGTTTLTVRNLDGKVLRIYAKSGSTWSWSTDYVYEQGLLLAAVDATTTRYFQLDHLGTPRLITGSGGTTLAIHDCYPFGTEAAGTADGERMKFTGHELDSMGTVGQGDDLYNMHARFYNASIARFLSPDPLRGDPHSPQSFNLFAYVQNRPMTYTDPRGLAPTTEIPCPDWAPPGATCYGYPGPDPTPYNPYSTIIHWLYFGPESHGSSGGPQSSSGTGAAQRSLTRPCVPYREWAIGKAIEAVAVGEIYGTAELLVVGGTGMIAAGAATTPTGVGPAVGIAGVFVDTLGVGVAWVGYQGTLDLVGKTDLGIVPPACP